MLVLSRRESEKVLFPSLGITIEVTRIKGNTVRLGVDAPREVRVIRAELDDDREHQLIDPGGPQNDSFAYCKTSALERTNLDREREIQENLDAVSLTVQLAQNQLRQGLSTHAEEALENAIASLRELEATLAEPSGSRPLGTACVRESNNTYQVNPIAEARLPAQLQTPSPPSPRALEVRQLVDLLESEFRSWSV